MLTWLSAVRSLASLVTLPHVPFLLATLEQPTRTLSPSTTGIIPSFLIHHQTDVALDLMFMPLLLATLKSAPIIPVTPLFFIASHAIVVLLTSRGLDVGLPDTRNDSNWLLIRPLHLACPPLCNLHLCLPPPTLHLAIQ